jgi:hypothetical protein
MYSFIKFILFLILFDDVLLKLKKKYLSKVIIQ